MDSVTVLRQRTLDRLGRFMRSGVPESRVVQRLVDIAAEANEELAFLGGFPRAFLQPMRERRIRDIDVVGLAGTGDALVRELHSYLVRRTRFGGFVFRVDACRIDYWPLASTWAIRERKISDVSGMEALLRSTFFNIESIAVTISPSARPRRSVLHEFQALSGFVEKILDIQLEPNPFPDLCVARTFMFASRSPFGLRRRLAEYVLRTIEKVGIDAVIQAMRAHYGAARAQPHVLERWAMWLGVALATTGDDVIRWQDSQASLNFENGASFPDDHIGLG